MDNPVDNPVPMRPGKNGGKLRVGGTNRGGTGRPPEEFRELCRSLVSSPKSLKAVEAILGDDKHPHFASLFKYLADRGYGKPEQTIQHGAAEGTTMRFSLNLGGANISDDS